MLDGEGSVYSGVLGPDVVGWLQVLIGVAGYASVVVFHPDGAGVYAASTTMLTAGSLDGELHVICLVLIVARVVVVGWCV